MTKIHNLRNIFKEGADTILNRNFSIVLKRRPMTTSELGDGLTLNVPNSSASLVSDIVSY